MTQEVVLTSRTLGGLKLVKADVATEYLKLLVYGTTGVGKTILSGSSFDVPDMTPVLFIDVEGGTLSLKDRHPNIDVVRVQTWDDMQRVYDALLLTKHEYRTTVLDSLSEIQKFSMYNIMREVVTKDSDRDPDIPGLREWGKNIEQIRRLVRAFRDLPVHTIFTSLVAFDKDPKTGSVQARPSLSGKLAQEVGGFVDILVYMYTKVIDGEVKRLLLTSGTDRHVAKDRSGHLPSVIESPDMQKIYDYINNEQET